MTVVRSKHLLAAACLLFTSSCDAPADRQAAVQQADVPHLTGTVDLTLVDPHISGGPPGFGGVSGLVQGRDGTILVADESAQSIFVFAADGSHTRMIGGPGSGPGEFERHPCCLAIDADDRLWVLEAGTPGSIHRFDIAGDDARYLESIQIFANVVKRPVMFIDPNRMAVEFLGSEAGESRRGYLYFDFYGREIDREFVPPGPGPDSLDMVVLQIRGGGGFTAPFGAAAPFGPRFLQAAGPRGQYARSVSGPYDVTILDSRFLPLSHIERPHSPVPLSLAERDTVQRRIDRMKERLAAYDLRDLEIPQFKPALESLGFDQDDRLWVELTQPDGEPRRRADVYDSSHALIFTADWPRDVDLVWSTIRGRTGLGIITDEFDLQQVVRVRW